MFPSDDVIMYFLFRRVEEAQRGAYVYFTLNWCVFLSVVLIASMWNGMCSSRFYINDNSSANIDTRFATQ